MMVITMAYVYYVGFFRLNINEYIHNAMTNVVHSEKGTAKLINKNINYKIAGKTGTAQVVSIAEEDYDKSKLDPSQWDHALFIAFAPKENPQIAIAVFVENAGFGGTWAAPIASLMIEQYLTDSISEKNLRKQQRILEANLLNVKIKK